MSIRYVVSSAFLLAGCACAMVIVTGVVMSEELESGRDLLFAIAGMGGSALSLLLGLFVLFYRR